MPICAQNPFRTLLIAALAALTLALAACGGDDEGGEGPDPATLAPADAPIYLEATVRPEGELRERFDATFSKLLGVEDPGALLREEFEAELADEDAPITYGEDIEPWLGSRVGGFITSFSESDAEGAALIGVTDQDAAQEFLDKAAEAEPTETEDREYGGVSFSYEPENETAYGFVEEFLVLGTESGFEQAVDASADGSLAEDDAANASLEDVGGDGLFRALVDPAALTDVLAETGQLSGEQIRQIEEQLRMLGDEPVAFAAGVGTDTIELASSSPVVEGMEEPTDLVSTLPADSWLAFGAGDVGKQIDAGIDQFLQGFEAGFGAEVSGLPPGLPGTEVPDVRKEIRKATGLDIERDFAWIGDLGGFVQGSSLLGLGGGLVIEATDEAAAGRAVGKLQQALSRERALRVSPTADGFTIQSASGSLPIGAEIAVRDGRFVLAAANATVDDVLDPSASLEGSERFGAATGALGEGLTPSLFIDFPTIVSLIESSGVTGDPDYSQARQYLTAIDYMVAGSAIEDDRVIGRFVLGVKEGSSGGGETASAGATAALAP